MASLGEQAIGSIVKLNVNGVATNFIVVQQGLPGSMYDSSCNGTWLLMQDVYEKLKWDSSDNDYVNSDVLSYLNSTFINLFDSNIKNTIKRVTIPYGTGRVSSYVFLLSRTEVGLSSGSYASVEGSALSYFNNATNSVRIAYLNGSKSGWWLRSQHTFNNLGVWCVTSSGAVSRSACDVKEGVRPAIVLPSTLLVSSAGAVYINSAPTTPGTPSVPAEASAGDSITVSWSASTDADGNLSGYELYVSVNGGTWTQIYKGSSRSYAYTVPEGAETLSFRVRAYDSESAYSAYATSATVSVSSGAITGTVIINGVQRELTGEGYINISGVLRDLTESQVNVGGVLKSTKG